MSTEPKVSVIEMLEYYAPHAVVTDGKTTNPPPEKQYGYFMGGDGRIATDAYAMQRAKSSYPDNWNAYYQIYKRWIGHRVFDCNALAEAFYKEKTGINIDTKAKLNFANWCSAKDKDLKDNKLLNLPQMRGVALFSGPTNSAAGITHVGFLFKKVGPGPLDWLVLECRGKEYGLVITTLQSRSWEWWGIMDKRFYYEGEKEEVNMPKIVTQSNAYSAEGLALQQMLNAYEYTSNDGNKLVEDGKPGTKTMEAFDAFRDAHGTTQPVTVEVPAALPDALTLAIAIGGKTYTAKLQA